MFQSWIQSLTEFTQALPHLVQWVGVMLAGMIPFVESYGATGIGIVVGIHPALVILSAIVGNVVSMLAFVIGAGAMRDIAVGAGARSGKAGRAMGRRTLKVRNLFDRYGIAAVSLIGQTMLPSQITSAMMVSFGASKGKVIFWQSVSIVMWAAVFGAMALGLLEFVRG